MTYQTTAYDPEVGTPRVYGRGDTIEESLISCLNELCDYLQETSRWAGAGKFKFGTKKYTGN